MCQGVKGTHAECPTVPSGPPFTMGVSPSPNVGRGQAHSPARGSVGDGGAVEHGVVLSEELVIGGGVALGQGNGPVLTAGALRHCKAQGWVGGQGKGARGVAAGGPVGAGALGAGVEHHLPPWAGPNL